MIRVVLLFSYLTGLFKIAIRVVPSIATAKISFAKGPDSDGLMEEWYCCGGYVWGNGLMMHTLSENSAYKPWHHNCVRC